ncbi:MAG: hypothetical protein L3J16_03390 [Anaerolineales bacterium]|nr:hypothetical protein [Anaerolineales bacterium]
MKKYFLLTILIMLMAACAPQSPVDKGAAGRETGLGAVPEENSPLVDTVGTLPAGTVQTAPTPNKSLRPLVETARADLAGRLSVKPEMIVFAKAVPITWPDAGLGCPQAGMDYAQVLTSGYKITFELDGQFYNYHTDEAATVIYCAAEDGYPSIPLNPGEIKDGEPWVPVGDPTSAQ